jgi:hypothetical protein
VIAALVWALPAWAGGSSRPRRALTGAWIAVAEGAPAGPVRMGGCFPVHDAFNFDVEGGRVTVTLTQSRWGAVPPPRWLALSGGWQGDTLVLDGREERVVDAPPEHWTLRWDARRQQLVGERNGAPFRLGRLIISSPPPGRCGSPPP